MKSRSLIGKADAKRLAEILSKPIKTNPAYTFTSESHHSENLLDRAYGKIFDIYLQLFERGHTGMYYNTRINGVNKRKAEKNESEFLEQERQYFQERNLQRRQGWIIG